MIHSRSSAENRELIAGTAGANQTSSGRFGPTTWTNLDTLGTRTRGERRQWRAAPRRRFAARLRPKEPEL